MARPLYQAAGLSKRNFSKRKSEKRDSVNGILWQQLFWPPRHPAGKHSQGGTGSPAYPQKHREGCATNGARGSMTNHTCPQRRESAHCTRPQPTAVILGRVHSEENLDPTPKAPRERQQASSGESTQLVMGTVLIPMGEKPLSPKTDVANKTRKTGEESLKQEAFFKAIFSFFIFYLSIPFSLFPLFPLYSSFLSF